MLRRSAVATLAISASRSRRPRAVPGGDLGFAPGPGRDREETRFLAVDCPGAALRRTGNRGALVTSANPVGGAGCLAERGGRAGPLRRAVGRCDGPHLAGRARRGLLSFAAILCGGLLSPATSTLRRSPGGAAAWRATDLDGDGLDTHLTGSPARTRASASRSRPEPRAAAEAEG